MELVEKLEKWIKEHPTEAELPAMNVTTGKTYTIKAIFEKLKAEKEGGVAALTDDELEVKEQISKWIKEV
ncbi:hypothetical protein EH223_09110 [candidate division KSB1 bacterium]|nr:hypothetical protein [candidate division KSB1 bacterium]RQW03763.1 MAG: hypothetical protein EH223_09110 [candidate division KSB1 bacterium]